MINVISYNVNGIRSALAKGFYGWLEQSGADIVCLQEVKATPEQVNLAVFDHIGYAHYWFPAGRKGYSGVAVLTRIRPDRVVYGMGVPEYDGEGRVLRLDFEHITLLNVYVPSGVMGATRQAFKMRFLSDFSSYLLKLKEKRPHLVVSGDLNIAHRPADIYDPAAHVRSSGFLPEERRWLGGLLDAGFIDTYRLLNPSLSRYTWWGYRAGARARNQGWRIDYHLVTRSLRKQVTGAFILGEVSHSDHCPVQLKIIF